MNKIDIEDRDNKIDRVDRVNKIDREDRVNDLVFSQSSEKHMADRVRAVRIEIQEPLILRGVL